MKLIHRRAAKPAFRLAWTALAIFVIGARVGIAAEPSPAEAPAQEKKDTPAGAEQAQDAGAPVADPARALDQRIAALDTRIGEAKKDPASLDHLKALRGRLLHLKKLLLQVVQAERAAYEEEERLTKAIAERERARLLGEQMEARRVRALARLSEVKAEQAQKERPEEKAKPAVTKRGKP